jgi:hypothetical protein
VATVIAKSKLLVLPVYPAAWPQARLHPLVQAAIRLWHRIASLRLVRKIGYRYRQTETVAATIGDSLRHTAAATGLSRLGQAAVAGLNGTVAWMSRTTWIAMARLVAGLSRLPMVGGIVQRYVAHYDHANRVPTEKFSDKARGFFERWSVKFTVEYYEAKEQRGAVSSRAGA